MERLKSYKKRIKEHKSVEEEELMFVVQSAFTNFNIYICHSRGEYREKETFIDIETETHRDRDP